MLSSAQGSFALEDQTFGDVGQQNWQTGREAKKRVRAALKNRRRIANSVKIDDSIIIAPMHTIGRDQVKAILEIKVPSLDKGPPSINFMNANAATDHLFGAVVTYNRLFSCVPISKNFFALRDVECEADILFSNEFSLAMPLTIDRAERPAQDALAPAGLPSPGQQPIHGETAGGQATSAGLPMALDFAPSKELVAYWVRGIEHYIKLSKRKYRSSLSDYDKSISFDSILRSEFTDRLWSALIMQLRRERDHVSRRIEILGEDRYFSAEVEDVVCNSFAVVPRETSNFLETGSEELYKFFLEGGRKAGEWGRIEYVHGRVVAILSEKKALDEPASAAYEIDVSV